MIKTITYKKYKDLLKQNLNGSPVNIIEHSNFVKNLFKLDKKVNDQLQNKKYSNSSWSIRKLEIDNFLSYGKNNVIEFDKLNGLVGIFSKNFMGKTVLCIDSLLFLFFNTTTRTSKSEEIFNLYTKDDIVKVKGYIKIDNSNYIIEREIIRKWKKDGTPNCSTELNFYKELDNDIIENLEGEQRQETDKIIKSKIGDMEDFIMTIFTTGDNLMNFIETKPTERGLLLCKFLGLNIFKEKEEICKTIFNDWKTTLKSNLYNIPTLKSEIEELQSEIKQKETQLKENKDKLVIVEKNIKDTKETKDSLLSSLHQDIDDKLLKSDPLLIENKISAIEKDVTNKKNELKEIKFKIDNIKVTYSKIEHEKLIQKERELSSNVTILKNDIERLEKDIKELKEGEICSKCGQSLKGIDHSKEIKELKIKLESNNLSYKKYKEDLNGTGQQLKEYNENKDKIEQRDKLQLKFDRTEIEIDLSNINLQKENDNLKNYHKNIDKINQNNKTNEKIRDINFKVHQQETDEKELISIIREFENIILNNNKDIEDKIKIGKEIREEEKIYKVFTIYLSLMGKNGISKSILRDMIPKLNNELSKLLEGVAEFTVEVSINENNQEMVLDMKDNKTGLIKSLKTGSGYERTIASLALRVVLNKINSLPKPNFIIFDEPFEKVSEENLQEMSYFLDRIKKYYDLIFLVTFNSLVKDWVSNVITIEKINNISTINLN